MLVFSGSTNCCWLLVLPGGPVSFDSSCANGLLVYEMRTCRIHKCTAHETRGGKCHGGGSCGLIKKGAPAERKQGRRRGTGRGQRPSNVFSGGSLGQGPDRLAGQRELPQCRHGPGPGGETRERDCTQF